MARASRTYNFPGNSRKTKHREPVLDSRLRKFCSSKFKPGASHGFVAAGTAAGGLAEAALELVVPELAALEPEEAGFGAWLV
jgi:hypothetical protein